MCRPSSLLDVPPRRGLSSPAGSRTCRRSPSDGTARRNRDSSKAPASPRLSHGEATSASMWSSLASTVAASWSTGSSTPHSTCSTDPYGRQGRLDQAPVALSPVEVATRVLGRPPAVRPGRHVQESGAARSLEQDHRVQGDVLELDAVHLASLAAEREPGLDLTRRAESRHRPEWPSRPARRCASGRSPAPRRAPRRSRSG